MAMRIGGLASGMDIDTIVSDLMKAERLPLNKLTKSKQTLEWQRDEYREMNKLLDEFDNYTLDNISLQSSLLKKNVKSSNSNAVSATANASAANVSTTINVTSKAESATWISDVSSYKAPTKDTEIELKVKNGDGSESGAIKLTIKAGATVEEILSQLSNQKELGLSGFAQSGKAAITKNDSGAAATITLVDADAVSIFTSLGFNVDTTTDPNTGASSKTLSFNTGLGAHAGKNADFTINGLRVTDKASNTFTINNVTYTLQNTGTANISVSVDSDNMFDKVVQFVNKYNETIEKINEKLTEERYRDYQPLTDEEKEAMSEKQIEKWEELAKKGLVRNDPILSSALIKMRSDFYNPVSGGKISSEYSQLTQIGIKTSSNYLDKGKLIIEDEAKLKEAIQKDPNAIYELFNANGITAEEKGIAKRLRETISGTIKSIEQKAGKSTFTSQQYTLGRNLTQIDKQIDRFEDRLTQIEDRYWKQFTAMEKAIQQSNTQMSYLMQQFG